MIISNKQFDFDNNIYVMGILNVTPDSFSDGNEFFSVDDAKRQALRMVSEGADIIDIGGESTRPGYIKISDEEEIERVLPVIEAIKKETDIPLSLDTYKSKVAKAGIDAGIGLINDIWGLKYDSNMAKVIKEGDVSCCLMHNRDNMDYTDFYSDYLCDIEKGLARIKEANIDMTKILIDPGVGFAKNTEQNLLVIKKLSELGRYNVPVYLGASRKSVVGNTLGLPVEQRLEGSLAIAVYGALHGAKVVRVHDVKETVRAIRMTEAITNI